ncbi:MAG: response regulator [Gammaproteobacteria bacterium]|nr:response regulator [Gammaproteobacteria bacterium]
MSLPSGLLGLALNQAKLLVVDDEAANVKLLTRLLEAEGYQRVLSTLDSREVVDLYREHQFDLVLLDIRMPNMDGFEVMRALQSVDSSDYVPVLVLTAQTDKETRLKALECGAKDFVNKPFDRLEVMTRIRNILQVRLLHNRIRQENRTLEQQVQLSLQQLESTRLEVLRRLGLAAEYRDNETGYHIVRMSKYSQLIAQAFGLPEEHCTRILQASPMHDIGKIGIPDAILLKPGKLAPDEWAIMKTHASIGAEILSQGSALLEAARVIALSHHEKWDGSGYPQGLVGEQIPIEGRIVAVADVFDALTSERPYKKAWNVNDAVAEIRRGSGAHFQPEIVDAFDSILPEISVIQARYKD